MYDLVRDSMTLPAMADDMSVLTDMLTDTWEVLDDCGHEGRAKALRVLGVLVVDIECDRCGLDGRITPRPQPNECNEAGPIYATACSGVPTDKRTLEPIETGRMTS